MGDITKAELAFLIDKVKHFGLDVAALFVEIVATSMRALVGLVDEQPFIDVVETFHEAGEGALGSGQFWAAWSALRTGLDFDGVFTLLLALVSFDHGAQMDFARTIRGGAHMSSSDLTTAFIVSQLEGEVNNN